MKSITITTIVIIIITLMFSAVNAQKSGSEADKVLISTEAYFKALKNKQYQTIWDMLTQKSKTTIIDETYKEEVKRGNADITREMLQKDFETSGGLAKIYWNSFLDNFNPDTVLIQSKWNVGTIRGSKAEVIVKYRKSDLPAILQLFKEGGVWKFGLVETFWTSKR